MGGAPRLRVVISAAVRARLSGRTSIEDDRPDLHRLDFGVAVGGFASARHRQRDIDDVTGRPVSLIMA
jgi:hypothetical protein